jgi:hypothetical protein
MKKSDGYLSTVPKRFKINKYFNYDGADLYVEFEVLKEDVDLDTWVTIDYADTYEEAIGIIKEEIKKGE